MKPVMKPTIHLNGTGEMLLVDLAEAAMAIRDAFNKLADAAPNGRDYYVAPGTWEQASAWHSAKLAELRQMQQDLAATAAHIQDQMDALAACKAGNR